ncbi:4'-phosphopantetheinyl transferase [Micromonospora sp. NPDC049460]|uniref:4'-phosphopantetheinyl transferase n=1 Tax=Micromonospora sp. NPDC049460 TaxID=3364272 RepID=UPI0037A583DA
MEQFEDILGEEPFPGEEDLIAGALDSRRREFVTARRCARQALEQLGHAAAPLTSGPCREPLWPPVIVGSITHCSGYRAAAVAPRTDLAGLGIDAEPHASLPGDVEESVTGPAERARLRELEVAVPRVHWGRVLFSAKEIKEGAGEVAPHLTPPTLLRPPSGQRLVVRRPELLVGGAVALLVLVKGIHELVGVVLATHDPVPDLVLNLPTARIRDPLGQEPHAFRAIVVDPTSHGDDPLATYDSLRRIRSRAGGSGPGAGRQPPCRRPPAPGMPARSGLR